MDLISVVIPVYKAEGCLHELYRRLKSSLAEVGQDYEIILVEDCGGDRSWEIIQELAAIDDGVKGIKFSRNFGQHHGITAGLDHCLGEWVVVMDCDLQDRPEEIPRLFAKAKEGYDIVFARRFERKEGLIKKLFARMFYAVFDYLTEQRSDPTIANFGIYHRRVIDGFCQLRESVRAFPLFVRWLGFNSVAIDVDHAPRHSGESSYTFRKLMRLAIESIIAQSNRPLRLSIKFGFFMALGSILTALYYTFRYFLYDVPVEGWTSVIVSIYFIGGLFFINTGFVGIYVGRIYDETKKRPLYVIKESLNVDGSIC
ncbi:MAG: glycosyltransferase [Sedimenticola sp.]|nr:MAG: glycosyltransferase [Sedimenticola sp.]